MLPGEREDSSNANQEELKVDVNEKTPFTWDPDLGEEQQEIEADENVQINTFHKPPKSSFAIVIVVFFIWIATVLSLYKWFGS
jgi:hypothetical protein